VSNLAGSVRELLAGDALDRAEETVARLMASPLPAASASSDTANDHHVDGLLDAASNLREAARVCVEFLMATESGVPSLLRLLGRLLRLDPRTAATTADTVCAHVFDSDAADAVRGERPLFATVAGVIAASVERDVLALHWLEVGQIEAEQGGLENSVVTFLVACRFVRGALRACGGAEGESSPRRTRVRHGR
jgi:hypothetical protein